MPSRTSSRSSSTGAALDPYGIYGTRTANRVRAARRRRQTQNIILLIVVAVVIGTGFSIAKLRRVTSIKPSERATLLSPVVAPPLRVVNAKTKAEFVLLASSDGRLLRYDASLENTRPQVVMDSAFPLHTPLVQNNLAFVPSEDGVLYAADWQNSRVLWRYNFQAPLSARPVSATLQIAASTAPRPVPTADAEPDRSDSARASTPGAVNAAASNPGPPTATNSASSSTKVKREIVVAASEDGLIAALDAGTGKLRWKMRLPASPGEALSVTTGNSPKVIVPLLGATFTRGGVWCLDAATGKVLWRFPKDGRSPASQLCAPIVDVAANRVFFGNETGAVFSLDLKTGNYDAKKKLGWKIFVPPLNKKSENAILWRANPVLFFGGAFSVEQQLTGERVVGSTRLILAANDGGVRCLSSQSGKILWQFNAGAAVCSLQKMRGGGRDLILVGTRGQDIYILDSERGNAVRHLASREILQNAVAGNNAIFAITQSGALERFTLQF